MQKFPALLAAPLVVVLLSAGIGGGLWGQSTSIPMSTSYWRYYSRLPQRYISPGPGVLETVSEGLKFYADGYRASVVVHSVAAYDLRGKTIYIKWKPNGANDYMGISLYLSTNSSFPPELGSEATTIHLPSTGWTTDHSFNGSIVLQHNVWYYTRAVVTSSAYVTAYTAQWNYDNLGGTLVDSTTKYMSSTVVTPCIGLGDSYAGTAAYIIVGEVRIESGVVIPPGTVTLNLQDVSATPGSTVDVPLVLTASNAAPAAFQLDVSFSPSRLRFNSASRGEQLTYAGKDLASTTSYGQVRLAGAGLNQNTIGNGTVARLNFTVDSSFPTGTSTTLGCSSAQSVTAQGQSLTTSCSGSRITVSAGCSCDVNGDGAVNIADVQLEINRALGIAASGCDVNGDGTVNIADVQIVINAALGLGCRP